MEWVWSELNRFSKMLEVELAVLRAQEELGIVPRGTYEILKRRLYVDEGVLRKIKERERTFKHDVLSFVSVLEEMGGEEGKYIHFGLTSSDVLDTALALQLVEGLNLLLEELKEVLKLLKEKAFKYKETIMMGRTHGVHAEPITFGLKLLSWYWELRRCEGRLKVAREVASYGKISSAVGTYSNVPPEVEERALKILGLKREGVSTQIVPRDRHAFLILNLSLLGSSLERFALEIRHLQRTEVLEVLEPFTEGQRGSSAMPHKKNPILSERICGLSRLLRSYSIPAMENVALWHERDISHSSVERVIFPDAFILSHYLLKLFKFILEGMRVNEDRMRENFKFSKNLFFSSKLLLKLIERGYSRDEAYDLVQRVALKTWEEGRDFLEEVKREGLLDEKTLKELTLESFLKNKDQIFNRFRGRCFLFKEIPLEKLRGAFLLEEVSLEGLRGEEILCGDEELLREVEEKLKVKVKLYKREISLEPEDQVLIYRGGRIFKVLMLT